MDKKILFLYIIVSLVFSFFYTVYAYEVNHINNPDLSVMKDGSPEHWELGGQTRVEYDSEEKVAKVYTKLTNDYLLQTLRLSSGHYLLRVLAKTDSMTISLKALGRMPLKVSKDYEWTELPFYLDGTEEYKQSVMVGLNIPSTGGGTQGDIFTETKIKKIELLRLGDTVLPRNWGTTISAHPLHRLETINNNPNWERPGKVIFNDSFIGTELWLMTQDGQINLMYVGWPHFSNDGKYVQVGVRTPGHLLRTDGSYRYNPPSQTGTLSWIGKMLWLFPWEQKRLPEGTDISDWIMWGQRTAQQITLHNLATEEKHILNLPTRPGWQIISVPSIHRDSRGPNINSIDHETLVWYSDDKKSLAVSNVDGENFKTIPFKSISRRPENDLPLIIRPFYLVRTSQRFYNAIDKNSTRYFLYDFNHGKSINDPYNPYQIWALSLKKNDKRGPLRVIPNPNVNIPEDIPGGTEHFFFNKNTECGYLLLEDGTVLYESSLGYHSGFSGTIRAQAGIDAQVRFIGSYPRMDHVSWPNEFQDNRDYAIVWAGGCPDITVAMIDLWHDTFWTILIKNSDYFKRQKKEYAIEREKGLGRGEGRAGAFLIVPAPKQSPDFTKVIYSSSMLVLKNAKGSYGDAYIAVARYPQPPVNVRFEGKRLVWDKPQYNAEIMGYNIYYSKESGKGSWTKLNPKPIREMFYELSGRKNGFYVVTSVEHSGLESRIFSNEVSLGNNRLFRLFYQPEEGELINPMVPFFEPKNASNCYAVAVTDPELIYKKQLEEGLEGKVRLKTNISIKGRWKVMARVRGMSGIERESYTTGWLPQGEIGKGSFTVKIGNKTVGKLPVEGFGWRWVEVEGSPIDLTTGKTEIVFSTSDTGIAIDNILITNDLDFTPTNLDNTPTVKPSTPQKVKISEIKGEGEPLEWRGYTIAPPYVRIEWELSTAPQGIRYYNIYRGEDKDFEVGPETLIGSETDIVFTDLQLKKGTEYYYKIVAVDNWNNRSDVSEALMVKIR